MTPFRERLVPGVGTTIAVLLLLPAVTIVFLPISALLGISLGAVVTVAAEALLVVGSPVIAVTDGQLLAGRARIPVALTGETLAFRGRDATAERGVRLDARAYTLFRGWVDPVVRVQLVDEDDPAPYWLLSTRRPAALQAALAAARPTD